MLRGLVVSTALFAGCADEPFCPDTAATIQQGVYGQYIFLSDVRVARTDSLPHVESKIVVRDLDGTLVGEALRDDRGFFEIALPAGAFRICGDSRETWCTDLAITDGELVRYDFYIGLTVRWSTGPMPCQ